MKKITSLEKSIYKDILFTILGILISIPVWLNFNLSASAMEAEYYDNYNYVQYEVLNKADSKLIAYHDNDALRNCETSDIIIYNDSNTIDNYSLLLKINKNCGINLENIKINVNFEVDYLNNYYAYTDAENYYYVIDSGDMVASSQKYIISLWKTNDVIGEPDLFNYDFMVI